MPSCRGSRPALGADRSRASRQRTQPLRSCSSSALPSPMRRAPRRQALSRPEPLAGEIWQTTVASRLDSHIRAIFQGRFRYTPRVSRPLRPNAFAEAGRRQLRDRDLRARSLSFPRRHIFSGAPRSELPSGAASACSILNNSWTRLGGYVAEAQAAVASQVKLPQGLSVQWSGHLEYPQRAEARFVDELGRTKQEKACSSQPHTRRR